MLANAGLMKLVILVLWGVFVFGQSTSAPPESKAGSPAGALDQNPSNDDYGLGIGAHGRQVGHVEILSETQGVDFGPYVWRIEHDVRKKWFKGIPESAKLRKGKLAIELALTKDGRVAQMKLVATSGDADLDRPAWDGITASNPFPPLPRQFNGPYLALRMRFSYSPEK